MVPREIRSSTLAYRTDVRDVPVATETRVYTRTELLDRLIAVFGENPEKTFTVATDPLDDLLEIKLRSMSTERSEVLEAIEQTLNECGVETDGSVGSLMTPLGFSQLQIHVLACWCVGFLVDDQRVVKGRMVATRLTAIRDNQF
jgi:hypothetical protein